MRTRGTGKRCCCALRKPLTISRDLGWGNAGKMRNRDRQLVTRIWSGFNKEGKDCNCIKLGSLRYWYEIYLEYSHVRIMKILQSTYGVLPYCPLSSQTSQDPWRYNATSSLPLVLRLQPVRPSSTLSSNSVAMVAQREFR